MENLLPGANDLTCRERAFPFRWYDIDHIFNTYLIFDSKQKTFVSRLEEESGALPNKEILKDKDLIEEYKELIGNSVICEDKDILEDILDYYNPESFTDLIRVISLVHGTGVWEDNGRFSLKEWLHMVR